MLQALGPFRPVLIAALLLMVSHGLMSSILPVRLAQLDAPAQIAGLITTAFFLGQVFGARLGRRLLARAGHIRGFAATIAVVGVGILLIPMIDSPWVWMALRFVMGICTVLAILILESWLNMASDNTVRGSVFGSYMVVVYVGLTSGQAIIGVVDAATFVPFSIAAMVLMLAILPLSLTSRTQPELPPSVRLRLIDLLRISPVGIAATVVSGALMGAMYGLFPFYASAQGLSPAGVATFMSAVIGGGLVLSWPLGRLSDLVDRRVVIALSTAAVLGTSFLLAAGAASLPVLVAAGGLMGGATAALYSLGVAHTNDYVGSVDAVAVGAGMLLAFSIGAIIGPVVASFAMDLFAPSALFFYTGVVSAALLALTIVRLFSRQAVSRDEKSDFATAPPPGAVPYTLDVASGGDGAETVPVAAEAGA